MAWKISYTETARKQLRKLDRQIARRIVDFMDERVAALCVLVIEIGNRKDVYRKRAVTRPTQ